METYFLTDPPSAPTGPLIMSNNPDSSFTLSWNPPIMDGGAEVLEYIIERKEVSKKAWLKVSQNYIFNLVRLIIGLYIKLIPILRLAQLMVEH